MEMSTTISSQKVITTYAAEDWEAFIEEWMQGYEKEFSAGESPRVSREEIFQQTRVKWTVSSDLWKRFISRFFGLTQP